MLQRGGVLVLVQALAAAACASVAFAESSPSVAFFYGRSVPVAELGRFNWVVVEPDHLDARGLYDLQRAGVQVFAYLSLGEASPGAVNATSSEAPRGGIDI